MNIESNEATFEQKIRDLFGAAPVTDFDQWCAEHEEDVAALGAPQANTVVDSNGSGSSKVWQYLLATAAMLALLFALTWVLNPGNPTFAQTVAGIEKAKTATWVTYRYERLRSTDGKRFWLQKRAVKTSYMHPGFYRRDNFDKDGNLERYYIDDPVRGERLAFDMKHKKFERVKHEKVQSPQKADDEGAKKARGPFDWVNEILKHEPIESVGQREIDGNLVNVFRRRNLAMGKFNPKNVEDIWIDAKSKQLVGMSRPGQTVFDPETLDYRDNPAEDGVSHGKILGSIVKEIVLDAKVDPAVFKLTIPDGFTEQEPWSDKPTQPITEKEFIEWLGLAAKVNDNQFLDSILLRNTEKTAAIIFKEMKDTQGVEREFKELCRYHFMNNNRMPFWDFIKTNTIPEKYRYVGKNVKLGSDAIILWYQMKDTGQYRAVYGDLTVKDIAEEDLPIK